MIFFISKLEKFIYYIIYKKIRKSKEKNKIVIFFSSGIDSNTLLNNMIFLLGKINILIVIINHNNIILEKFYKKYSKKILINKKNKYLIFDLNKKIDKKKLGLECVLRIKRNKIIKLIIKKYFLKNIFSTEHKNDKEEFLLIKILKNINKNKFKIYKIKNFFKIKPFKYIKKFFLKKFLIKKKIKWIEDQSNLKTIFTRNNIRINLLPKLKINNLL